MNTPTPEEIDAALAYLDARQPFSEYLTKLKIINGIATEMSLRSKNRISSVDASLDILAAALTAAREDSRRLDWLEGQAQLSTSAHNGIVRCWEIRDERPDCVGAYREIRTVIDAAIAAGKIDTP